jgi:hypothetical protein
LPSIAYIRTTYVSEISENLLDIQNTPNSRSSPSINMPKVHLLDYVAGNVRSLVNAIEKVGYEVDWVKTPEDVAKADVRCPCPHAAPGIPLTPSRN